MTDIERLRNLIYDLSDALTDEGPDWSDEGLYNLRRRVAEELPEIEWLQLYCKVTQ